jgi:hypothetical protein
MGALSIRSLTRQKIAYDLVREAANGDLLVGRRASRNPSKLFGSLIPERHSCFPARKWFFERNRLHGTH